MRVLVWFAKLAFVLTGLALTVFLGYLTLIAWVFEHMFHPIFPTVWEWVKWHQSFLLFSFMTLLSAIGYATIIIWFVRREPFRSSTEVSS